MCKEVFSERHVSPPAPAFSITVNIYTTAMQEQGGEGVRARGDLLQDGAA